jgi:hypothetical protein
MKTMPEEHENRCGLAGFRRPVTKRCGDTAPPPNVNPRTIAHAQPRNVYPQIAQMYADKTVFVFASSRLRAFA